MSDPARSSWKKASVLLCFCFGAMLSLFSQDYIDLFKLYGSHAPNVSYPDTGRTSSLNDWGVDILLPLPLNDSLAIISGVTIERADLDPYRLEQSTTQIYSAVLKLGTSVRIAQNKTLNLIALPKYAGDVGGSMKNEFQLGAYGLMKWSNEKGNSISTGLYANNDRFGLFLVPLIGAYYKKDRLEVNATLPVWADLNYRLSESSSIGVSFSAVVRSFLLNEFSENAYLERKSNDVMLYFQQKITPSFLLQLKSGYSIGRELEVYDANEKVDLGLSLFRFGDERKQLNIDPEDGVLIQVRLIYRYDLSK